MLFQHSPAMANVSTTPNVRLFSHCFHKCRAVEKTCRSLRGRLFPPSPLRFIFNQSGCETLPGCCSNGTHPAGGGGGSDPRADTPSLQLLLPRTQCALHHSRDIIGCRCRLRLLHHLVKMPSLFRVTPLSATPQLQETGPPPAPQFPNV